MPTSIAPLNLLDRHPLADKVATLMRIAQTCRARILDAGFSQRSCIETSYLVQQVLLSHGMCVKCIVTTALVTSPALQAMIDAKVPAETIRSLWVRRPDLYAVKCGHPGDTGLQLGESSRDANVFAGHVCCVVEISPSVHLLVDGSADQMHRPNNTITLREPTVLPFSPSELHIARRRDDGLSIEYVLFPMIRPPLVIRAKKLDRMARGLIKTIAC